MLQVTDPNLPRKPWPALWCSKKAEQKRPTRSGNRGLECSFIGLFGTVLGIIKAFHDLAAAQSEATEAVMAGISEALVATAIGLMVAIPAVILYNAFQQKVKNAMSKSTSLSHLMLAKLKTHTPESA